MRKPPSPERIARLPKWAQDYIRELRQELHYAYSDDAPPPDPLRGLEWERGDIKIESGRVDSTFRAPGMDD